MTINDVEIIGLSVKPLANDSMDRYGDVMPYLQDTHRYERHVVLVAPEVHWNTGNIGRTCIGADAYLHLIRPLGFSLESKQVKRAGLDYWPKVKLRVWDHFGALLETFGAAPDEIALLTKNGTKRHWELPCRRRLFLVFGSETKGLPPAILDSYADKTFRIPISNEIRCLNLSTAVGIALYESLRPLPRQ